MVADAIVERIRAVADIGEVIGSFVALQKQGKELVACCPLPGHNEKTPSFKVNVGKGFFKCFGCGKSGDVFKFVQEYKGVAFPDAVRIVGEIVGVPTDGKKPAEGKPLPAAPAAPKVPDEELKFGLFVGKPPTEHEKLGKPDCFYSYHKESGREYFRVARWNAKAGGKKIILPMAYLLKGSVVYSEWDNKGRPTAVRKLEEAEYAWRGLPGALRGYFNADRFAAAKAIVVAEGEKAASAVPELFGAGFVGTTFIGGGKAAHMTNHLLLPADKRVILWADWDEEGIKAMKGVAEALKGRKQKVVWVQPPPGKPKGWDCADAVAEGLKKAQIPLGSLPPVFAPQAPTAAKKPPQAATPQPSPKKRLPAAPAQAPAPAKSPALPPTCVPLGYTRADLFLWDSKSASVVSAKRTVGGVSSVLITLGDLSHWERNFAHNRQGKVNWQEAVSVVMRACERVGTFNEDQVKGRGVYLDDKKAVLNTGDRLILEDGGVVHIKEQDPLRFDSFFAIRDDGGAVYLPPKKKAASAQEARDVLDILWRLGWSLREHAVYLFGWMAISVVSGALRWRPHIWLSGASGAGKTWVMDNIIDGCLREYAIHDSCNTSEASLRRKANDEARPIIFDEAETKDRASQENMKAILGLARTSSSHKGAHISKAGTGRNVESYRIKSPFLFASVTMPLSDAADMSRFVHLSLRRQGVSGKEWDALQTQTMRVIDKDFWAGWVLRAFMKTRQINAAAEQFIKVLRVAFGDQRLADTRGTILGGAWAILQESNRATPTEDDIATFIATWGVETGRSEVRDFTLDHDHALNIIASKIMRVDFGSDGSRDVSVGEMIYYLTRESKTTEGTERIFARVLGRYGLRIEDGGDFLLIANSPNAKRFFTGTAWEMSWFDIIRQHRSVTKERKVMRFGGRTYSAHLRIPIDSFLTEDSNG